MSKILRKPDLSALADYLRNEFKKTNANDATQSKYKYLLLYTYNGTGKTRLSMEFAEARIRQKLLKDGHSDTVIGLPANLFYSTGIPVCILVLKKCKQPDDVLFINASEHFEKGKRQNSLSQNHINKIIATYQYRTEEERYSRRVAMDKIETEGYNLNISRYISTAKPDKEIDLSEVNTNLVELEQTIKETTEKHNKFLRELGLPLLPE